MRRHPRRDDAPGPRRRRCQPPPPAASLFLFRSVLSSRGAACGAPGFFGGTYDTKSTTQAAPDPDGPPFAPWCAADGRSGGLHHGGPGMSRLIDSPCQDCPNRRPGCHNASVCRAWAEFTAANEARRARDLAAFRAENDWSSVRIQRAVW